MYTGKHVIQNQVCNKIVLCLNYLRQLAGSSIKFLKISDHPAVAS